MRGSHLPVAIGGAVGTLARVGIGLALPATPGGWPVATLLVNVSGALLLGVVLTRLRDHWLRAMLGTGVLGAWTTFSTFAVELDVLLRTRPVTAVNVAGAGLFGVATVVLAAGPLLVVGGGLLGATTTFSTWMVHADTAPSTGRVVVLPLVAGVAAAAIGRVVATGLGWAT